MSVWPAQSVDERLEARLSAAAVLGVQRTPGQDLEFAVLQLVEIGVRALSPGTNDPFTAVGCIDRLSSALCRLAQRKMPEARRYDASGKLRVVAVAIDFPGMVDAAFNQLRQYGTGSADVTIRLLEAIAVVAQACTRKADFSALQKHADMIASGAARSLKEEHDQQEVAQRHQAVKRVLAQRRATKPRA